MVRIDIPNIIAGFIIIPLPFLLSLVTEYAVPGKIGAEGVYQPSFLPAAWGFASVWPTIYFMQGTALYLVYEKYDLRDRQVLCGYALFSIQLMVNYLFVPMSKMQSLYASVMVVMTLLLLVPFTTWYFYCLRPSSGALFITYQMWSVLAAALSATKLYLNIA